MQTLAGPLLIILAFLVNQTLTVRLARLPAEKVSDHTVSRLAAFDGVLTAVAYGAAVFVGMRAGKTDALWAVCLSGILLLLLLLLEIFLRRWAVAWSSDRDLLYPNRLRLVTRDTPELRPEQTRSDARVEDFLDHLCAPLVGIVPYGDRSGFRREAQGHLQDLICEYRYQGQGLAEATEAALQEFGDPWQIGRSFLEEWSQGTPTVRPAGLIRRATFVAFAWFGLASMLNLLLLEHGILTAPHDGWFPDVILLALLSPLLAGCLTGLTTPMQTAKGVRNAVLILSIHSFVTGLLLLPQLDGVAFALWQGAFWLPAGRTTASLTVALARHVRRQRFWQTAR